MRVVALTTSFQASHFEALEAPPTLVCGDFDEYLRSVSGALGFRRSRIASRPFAARRERIASALSVSLNSSGTKETDP